MLFLNLINRFLALSNGVELQFIIELVLKFVWTNFNSYRTSSVKK